MENPKKNNGEYYTVRDLQNLASDIAMKIYDEHPDIEPRAESRRLIDEIALSAGNKNISK